jgi:hypothetical protein
LKYLRWLRLSEQFIRCLLNAWRAFSCRLERSGAWLLSCSVLLGNRNGPDLQNHYTCLLAVAGNPAIFIRLFT